QRKAMTGSVTTLYGAPPSSAYYQPVYDEISQYRTDRDGIKEDFNRETGFYFGAAYVSYGLTVGFGIGLYLLLCVWGNVDTASFVIIFSLLLIALLPVFFRFSRLIWINLFVHPKKN
ncbi:MAG TPA: hypothetical protein PK289_04945, partial [Bacteroidia bacterium]|nr:hypothetical protein [Bacteroidia bacterium]